VCALWVKLIEVLVSEKPPKDGDAVEVKKSNSGYRGPGKLIGLAYGSVWLIRIPVQSGDDKEEPVYKTITAKEENFTVIVKKRN
jgi:hypothetical protein